MKSMPFDLYKKTELKLELTPLLDIIFILLIFFAVMTAFLSHNQGISLNLPTASSVTNQQPSVTISINSSQHFFLDNQQVSQSELSTQIQQIIADRPSALIMLNADQSLPYAIIIDALDRIRSVGASRITLQVRKVSVDDV
jgi:biopolymer transport protein ExbD